MLEKELANIHMHESLSGAIASNELYLVLQPIVGKNERQSCMAGECLPTGAAKTTGFIIKG
jgi:EAL domain-containing protein (putative c-di-GMP-specific phosphodiesterase class I)